MQPTVTEYARLYDLIVALCRPYTLLFLCVAVAVVGLWRRRRETRGRLLLLTVPFVGLTLVSTPALAFLAVGTLEWHYPPLDRRPTDAQAIVILAGGLVPPNAIHPRAELDEDSLMRCLHGADLYHQGPACPVLLSGGKVDPSTPGPSHARAMADFLGQLGVRSRDLLLEEESRTTFENAVECGKLLDKHGLKKALLVTSAEHMLRAELCFQKQGIEVCPSACHYRAAEFEATALDFLPSPGAARHCQRVGHEWLGTAWYWLRGRI